MQNKKNILKERWETSNIQCLSNIVFSISMQKLYTTFNALHYQVNGFWLFFFQYIQMFGLQIFRCVFIFESITDTIHVWT